MQYISTRGGMAPQSFSDILLGGLAPDGGLVVPTELPKLDKATLEKWRSLSYQDLAFEVISLFATDIKNGSYFSIGYRFYNSTRLLHLNSDTVVCFNNMSSFNRMSSKLTSYITCINGPWQPPFIIFKIE